MTKNPQKAPSPTWCPGCGAYTVSSALKKSLAKLGIKPKDTVISYDIGCSGNMSNILNVSAIETLHGRSIPVAAGIKSACPELTVIAQAGDGGLTNEGLNHFIHAIQRNDPLTLVVNNNYVFGLTAGQQSSSTPKGVQARGSKEENKISPLSVVDLAATAGAKFIARVPETDPNLMQEVFRKAILSKNFALVEIIQPCKIWVKTFPKTNFKTVLKPFKNRIELIGKNDVAGVLYEEN